MISIDFDFKKHDFLLSFRWNEQDLETVRRLPVRSWDKDEKLWRVPEKAVLSLDSLLSTWSDVALAKKKQIKGNLLSLVDLKFQVGEERTTSAGTHLRNYQSVGVDFLTRAKQGLLCDDMGLGKSIQSIQTLIDLGTKKNLILCPATLKWNWHQEFQKHFGLEPTIITGNATKRKELWNSEAQYTIANYEILQHDWNVLPKKWDAIVLDEAVYVKSHKATRTKLTKKLKSDVRIALTGLPMELHLMEFHSIFDWAVPGLLPSLYKFKYRYCNFDMFGKIIGYKNIDELHLLTSPFLLRRTKKEVEKELPEKIIIDVPLEFSEEAGSYYKQLASQFFDELNGSSNVLASLIKMQQFVEFPEILGEKIPSRKLEWLDVLYAQTDKVVVFTRFLQSANRLISHYKTPYSITGETAQEKRLGMVNDFNAKDKGIMICTDAGKFGINLTGADTIVHFGYSYNPATQLQREDRLHRIGQTKTVTVFRPYLMHSIDEGIRKVFLSRDANIVEFLDASHKMSVAKLSKKEFMKLVWGE